MFRSFAVFGLLACSACTEVESPESLAMLIRAVGPAGEDCLWDSVGEMEIFGGDMDLIGLSSDHGGVGHSRRYVIGVSWDVTEEKESGAEPGPDDNFIMLHHAEIRFHFEDATSMPTEETLASLPATYRVPTGGSTDVGPGNRIAVFDVIPTWIARRLAADRQIWMATSHDGFPAAGKSYRMPMEFRLIGTNLGGRTVSSNWFRWVITLCRGCRLRFSCAPPRKCIQGAPSLAGNYTADQLGMSCPLPEPPGVVRWCNGGVSQGSGFTVDAVCPTAPIMVDTYDPAPEEDGEEGGAP